MFAQASEQVISACRDASNCATEYSDLLRQYFTIAILGGLAIVLVAAMLGVAGVLRPPRRRGAFQDEKHTTYESGSDPVGRGWGQQNVRYYVFALLFVLFDVEAVFVFPWALRLEAYGVFGLVEMLAFIAILVLGLVYAWRKRVLQWL